MKEMLSKLFWIFIFCLLPLIYFPIGDGMELPKVLIFICVTFMYLGISVKILTYPIRYVKLIRLDWWLLMYVVVNIASGLVNSTSNLSLYGQYYRYEGIVTLLGLVAIYWLSSTEKNVKDGDWSKIFTGAVLVTTTSMLLRLTADRWSGNLGNPNFAGEYLALVGAGTSLVWSAVSFGAIYFTGSRTAILAAIGIWLLKNTKHKWQTVAVVILGLVGVVTISSNRQVSHFDNRIIIWQKSMEAASSRPILGWGRENFADAFQSTLQPNDFDLKSIRVDKAHNEWLEALVTTGVLGLITYLGMFATAVDAALQKKRLASLPGLVIAGYLIMSFFNVFNINSYVVIFWALGQIRRSEIT